jgi:hypothetical protein
VSNIQRNKSVDLLFLQKLAHRFMEYIYKNEAQKQLNTPKIIDYLKGPIFYLLMNQKRVENFSLSRRQVARILSKLSRSYKSASISYLIIDLSEYQHVVDVLHRYAQVKKINLKN